MKFRKVSVTLHVCVFHRFSVNATDPQKKSVQYFYKPCLPFKKEGKGPGCQDVAVSISLSGNLRRQLPECKLKARMSSNDNS